MRERNLRDIKYWSLMSGVIFSQVFFIQFLVYGVFQKINFEKLLGSSVIMLALLVLVFIVPAEWKHRIVFFKLKNELPASRVFTELINKDFRIDKQDLVSKIGITPTLPCEQNKLWFKLYNQVKFRERVFSSHKYFLLLRDATIALILLTLASSCVLHFYFRIYDLVALSHLLISLLVISGFALAANSLGKRFVLNVIVEATTDSK